MHDAIHMPLLLPKVRPPRTGSRVVLRPRLGRYVDSIQEAPLTVVSAPSGFGKTTTGTAWAKELRSKAAVVAWLNLDEEDNELTRFVQYLAFAVAYAYQDSSVAAPLSSGLARHSLQAYPLLSTLINRIAEEGSEFFLFLDDFHVITDEAIKDAIAFMLRRAPSSFHLVLLSHPHGVVDLPEAKPCTAFRIPAAELRFTEDETRELFDVHSKQDRQAMLAHRLTGGWAAPLRIMAASNPIHGRHTSLAPTDALPGAGIAELIDAVLSGLNPDQVRLVETTCIVHRMCSPLFTALTGVPDPGGLIETVEHRYNLLSRISEDGYWFGCHDLTREAVTRRLLAEKPDYVRDISSRASQWYAEQGYWAEAVTQALAAGMRDMAVRWIDACSMRLVHKGEVLTLLAWENRLQLANRPGTPLRILHAMAMARILTGFNEENSCLPELIQRIEMRLQSDPLPDKEKHYWHLQTARSILACKMDDLDLALELADKCLKQSLLYPAARESLRGVAAYAHLQFRRWPEFYQHSLLASKAEGNEYSSIPAIYQHVHLAAAEIIQLRFDRAQRYLEEADRSAAETLGAESLPGALCKGLLALIHYERLALPVAESLLNDALDLVAQTGYIDVICRTFTTAANVAALRQDNEYALSLLEKWEKMAALSGVARMQVIAAYEKTCFFLREKSYAQARASLARVRDARAAATSSGRPLPVHVQAYAGLAEGQYALATGEYREAKRHLDAVYHDAMQLGDTYMAVLGALPLAHAEIELGNTCDGISLLAHALGLAQHAGLKASLLSQPFDLARLFATYGKYADKDAGYIQQASFVKELADARSCNSAAAPVSLSPREISVLQLIAQDKSNKEISLILKIAPETVKTHIKNIFSKLDVSKRNAAVRRAGALNLL